MSINNSLISTLAKAETAIAEAQDRSKSSSASPFMNTALENLKHATTELTNVMKKVSENLLRIFILFSFILFSSLLFRHLYITFFLVGFWSLGDNEHRETERGDRGWGCQGTEEGFQILLQAKKRRKLNIAQSSEYANSSAFSCKVFLLKYNFEDEQCSVRG